MTKKERNDRYDYIFVGLCILCVLLIIPTFKYTLFAGGADEGYYMSYGRALGEKGLSIFPAFFSEYLANQRHWVFPNPFRSAYIAASAVWMRLFGVTYPGLASFSLFCHVMSIGLCYYFGRKHFGARPAVLFAALFAFSPLGMAMARRALPDNMSSFFLILCVWLFYEAVCSRQKYNHALFTAFFAIAILVKESSAVLAPAFIFYLAARRYILKKETKVIDYLSVTLYPAMIVSIIYIVSAGDIGTIARLARVILYSPSTNEYTRLYCSGPFFRYILDFLLLSPWVLVLAACFIALFFSAKEKNGPVLYLVMLVFSYYILMNIFTKNVRYVMLLDMPIRLFSALMILRISTGTGRYFRTFAYLAVLCLVVYDYLSFYNIFVASGVYDPVSATLLAARRLIP